MTCIPQHNKLREYKSEIYRLQKDLKEQKEQALVARNEYLNWNKKLQDRVKDFRSEKSSWQTEATAMRAVHKELQVGIPLYCDQNGQLTL